MKNNYNIPMVEGSSAIQSDSNMYGAILSSKNNLKKQIESTDAKALPLQANILLLQDFYLNLNHNKEIQIAGVNIDFLSDRWDFSKALSPGKLKTQYTYNFSESKGIKFNLSNYAITILKMFVLHMIIEDGVDCGTNISKFLEVRNFLVYIKEYGLNNMEEVNVEIIKQFYDNMPTRSYPTIIKSRRYLKSFLTFYCVMFNSRVFSKEMNDYFLEINVNVIKAACENNKIPCPPTSFYAVYSKALLDIVYDQKAKKFDRGYAGLLYIGSQTGLRCGELDILEVDNLEVMEMHGKRIGILNYRSTKNAKVKGGYSYGRTNASENVIKVFEILINLFASERESLGIGELVPNDLEHSQSKQKTLPKRKLKQFSDNLCLIHATEWGLIDCAEAELFESHWSYEKVKSWSYFTKTALDTSGLHSGQTFSTISIRQFRVYVATDYHERGVDDRTISYLLNHNSEEMFGYYVRPKHPVQENIDFSREVVKEILKDDLHILGQKGEAIKEKINTFISNREFNLETDIDTIIDKICMKMPIKQKAGGFCIKSNPTRQCRHDSNTDEFLCAYGCCPNHCHLYYMAPITYKKALDLEKIIDYDMQERDWVNAAQKQGAILEMVINKELVPEIEDLNQMISLHGRDWIIKRHPSVAELIDRLDILGEDILRWKTKIKKLKCA